LQLSALCSSDYQNKAWEYFQYTTCKSYSKDLMFALELFDALEKVLGSNCCQTTPQLTIPQKVMKINDKKWEFSTQGIVKREVEKDPTLGILCPSISLGASGENAKGMMAIVEF